MSQRTLTGACLRSCLQGSCWQAGRYLTTCKQHSLCTMTAGSTDGLQTTPDASLVSPSTEHSLYLGCCCLLQHILYLWHLTLTTGNHIEVVSQPLIRIIQLLQRQYQRLFLGECMVPGSHGCQHTAVCLEQQLHSQVPMSSLLI